MAVIYLASCQQHEGPGTQEATAKPEAHEAGSADGVTVITPGREPRRELRYRGAKATTTPFETATDLDMMVGSASAFAGVPPTVVTTGTLAIDDVLASGDMRVRFQIEHATVRPREGVGSGSGANPALFSAQAKIYEGFVETAAMSATGHLSDAQVVLPGATQEVRSEVATTVEQLAIPLPAQPVGIGARWKTSTTVVVSGIAMTQTTTTELTALAGDRATYTSAMVVSGADQHTTLDGVGVDVQHIAGTGSGTVTIDLATLSPSGHSKIAFHVDLVANGDSVPVEMAMAISFNEPAPP